MKYKTLIDLFITLMLFGSFTIALLTPEKPEQCFFVLDYKNVEFTLRMWNHTTTYAYGVKKADCTVLKDKCINYEQEYRDQWGLNCYWINGTESLGACICEINKTMLCKSFTKSD